MRVLGDHSFLQGEFSVQTSRVSLVLDTLSLLPIINILMNIINTQVISYHYPFYVLLVA